MIFYKKVKKYLKDEIMNNQIDTKVINKLAEVLNKNNLSELEYEDEKCRISIKSALSVSANTVAQFAQTENKNICVQKENDNVKDDCLIDDYSNHSGSVKAPIVGVVYLSPDPTRADYVSVGDKVKEGDIVCLIEAMKTFNPVKAHKSGIVTKILVESGDPVEYGESLLIIE